MTLEQYINQKDPKPFLTVDIVGNEPNVRIFPTWIRLWFRNRKRMCHTVEIFMLGRYWTYLLMQGIDYLYTMDDHGNPKSISVFRLRIGKTNN